MRALTLPQYPKYNKTVKTAYMGILALLLLTLPVSGDSYQPYTYQLPSGMTVILAPIPGMQATCVFTYHKNGVRHDPPAIRGASFLYQYLMLLATENLEDYDRLMFVRKNGGESSARVGNDYSYFSQLIPDHTISNALWLESERLTSLLFLNPSVNAQKDNLVKRLSALLQQNTLFNAQEWVRAKVMEKTVYQEPVFGSIETLRNLDNRSIRSRYPVFQNPENIILVVCGSLKMRETIALIRDHFKLPRKGTALKPETFHSIPPRKKGIEETWTAADTNLNSVIYGFRTPGLISRDYTAFQLIETFLTDPRVSQLDRILNQNNHLNIQISRESTQWIESNALIFKISSPSRLAIEKASYLVDRLLTALVSGKLSGNDLRQTRIVMEMDSKKVRLNPEASALNYARQYHMFGAKGRPQSEKEELSALTILDIHQVCREYLSPENRVILNVYKK